MLDPPDGEAWALKPGQMVEGYEIVESIGSGGYGQVYKAIEPDGALCALKWMRLARNKERNALKRAMLEITVLQQVDHINVVRYRGSGMTDEGNVWIAMELLEGVSFRELIGKETLDVERVLRLGRQVCDGLSRLHKINAVHRDIKPENLFLLAADVVKIIDFGIAKCAGVRLSTTRGQTLGTALYMAPDQLSYKGEQGDPRWDVYALGVVLYEMLLQRHPFEDEGELPTAAVICGMQLQFDIPPLYRMIPGFPKRVSDVIAKALEKDPTKRYASAKALGAALSAERKEWLEQHQEEDALAAPIERSEVQSAQRLALSSEPAKEPGPMPGSFAGSSSAAAAAAPIAARPPPKPIVTERIATPIVETALPLPKRPPRPIVTERIATPIAQAERPAPTSLSRQILTERIATLDASVPGGPVVTDRMPSDVAPQRESSWPAWLAAERTSGRPTLPKDSEGLSGPTIEGIRWAMPPALAPFTPVPAARATPVLDVKQGAAPEPGRMRRTLPLAIVIVVSVTVGYAIPRNLDLRAPLPVATPTPSGLSERSSTHDGGTSMNDGGTSIEDGGVLAASPALLEEPPAEPNGAGGSASAPRGSAASVIAPPGSKPAAPSRGTAPPPSRTPPPRVTARPSKTTAAPRAPNHTGRLSPPEEEELIFRPTPTRPRPEPPLDPDPRLFR